MNKKQAVSRIKKLKDEISHHRYLYHVLDKQEISDAALDSLKKELADLERQFPDLQTPDSPTLRVSGKALDKFEKVKHSHPVLSLEDAFSHEDLYDWESRIKKLVEQKDFDYFVELKLDGLTAVLRYEDGVFVQGLTRGDGKVGEDVTQNLRTIGSIPQSLGVQNKDKKFDKYEKGVFEVRGEVLMTKKQFKQLNVEQEKKGKPLYANPRNVAAGSIRQLDPKVAASRNLVFIAYEILNDVGQQTHSEVHDILRGLGFKVNDWSSLQPNMKSVCKYIDSWEDKRKKLSIDTDGMVVVVNSISSQKELGSVGKAQRWMIAYKFKAEQAQTVVEDIFVQVGRTGTLTPVAKLRPVTVAGSTVSRATLHNEDRIKELDIKIGDTVVIQKAGDIIPEVVQVLKRLRPDNAKKFTMPEVCPVCGAKVKRIEGEVATRCTNQDCFALQRERIIHFVSKAGFNIEGLGPQIIDKLINNDLLHDASDLFDLETGDLEPLDKFAEKSSQNLVDSIQSSKEIALPNFILSLGIRFVGSETSELLAKSLIREKNKIKSVKSFVSAIKKWSREDLEQIDGIGEKVAQSIYNFFKDEKEQGFLKELETKGIKIEPYEVSKDVGPLEDKTFVLTGELESLSRDKAGATIKGRGGKVTSSVSKNTDFIVVGSSPGSKYDKAMDLGVKVLTEKDFLQMIK